MRKTVPPRIARHRPDVVGAKLDGSYCIGEAKTKEDLRAPRSREQLEDYAAFLAEFSQSLLVLGCPVDASLDMTSLMLNCGLQSGPRVRLVLVPGPLLPSMSGEDDV
jgi:hypothetical protein